MALSAVSRTSSRAQTPGRPIRRASLLALMKRLPDFGWPELERAERRWETEHVDEFAELLTESSLAGKSTEELSDLAGALLSIGNRDSYASSVLDRALERDPSSFRLHFLAGALRFKAAMMVRMSDPEAYRRLAAEIVHHMEVAVALRPRSGFVRAMLANAMAISERYPESARLIEEATELEPDNALVWLIKARFYGYSPFPDRGVQACKRALELDPDLGGARELLAELESKVKR
jgi:predicted Zn-dependent protease